MKINPCPLPRLSLVGALLVDPAPSSQIALDSLHQAGQDLMTGKVDTLLDSPQLLDAALAHDGLSPLDRQLIGAYRKPTYQSESQLSQHLKQVSKERISTNYVHNFDMMYGAGGGFRGSRSYDSAGETELAEVTAFQKEGVGPTGPALVHVDFRRPAHVGPNLEGTVFDGKSSSYSTFFVTDLSKVEMKPGHSIAADADCKTRMEELFTQLDQAAPLQVHSYSTGWGRVGTQHHEAIRAVGKNKHHAVLGAATMLQGVHGILQIPSTNKPAAAETSDATGTALAALALGAAAGGLGMALSQVHPFVGLALGGAAICGAGLWGKRLHAENRRDYPLPDSNALLQRNSERSRRGLQNGLLLGVAATASAAAGAALGLPGVIGAGVVSGAAELLLSKTASR